MAALRVLDGGNEEHHFNSRYLLHAESLLVIGLVCHESISVRAFEERAVGLDHLSLNVATAEELQAWVGRLDELGIDHSGIHDEELWGLTQTAANRIVSSS